MLTSIHENPIVKQKVRKSSVKITPHSNNITPREMTNQIPSNYKNDLLRQANQEYQNHVIYLNQLLNSGQIDENTYRQQLSNIDMQKNLYDTDVLSGKYGGNPALLTTLIPLIPKAIEYGVKGIKWIIDKFKKKKEGGMINPFYRIKGVHYSNEVPGQLAKLLTGGRILLQNTTGGRLYLGGSLDMFGEGIRTYNIGDGIDYNGSLDDSEDIEGGEIDLDQLTDDEYYGSGLKNLSKLKYMIDMHKQGLGIDLEKFKNTHSKLMEILKKRHSPLIHKKYEIINY